MKRQILTSSLLSLILAAPLVAVEPHPSLLLTGKPLMQMPPLPGSLLMRGTGLAIPELDPPAMEYKRGSLIIEPGLDGKDGHGLELIDDAAREKHKKKREVDMLELLHGEAGDKPQIRLDENGKAEQESYPLKKAPRLKDGEEKRRPARLGLALTDVDEGVLVEKVREHSPAARAGLQAGDILLRIGDAPAGPAAEFVREIGKMAPGSHFRLTWRRGDKEFSETVNLDQMAAKNDAEKDRERQEEQAQKRMQKELKQEKAHKQERPADTKQQPPSPAEEEALRMLHGEPPLRFQPGKIEPGPKMGAKVFEYAMQHARRAMDEAGVAPEVRDRVLHQMSGGWPGLRGDKAPALNDEQRARLMEEARRIQQDIRALRERSERLEKALRGQQD